MFNYKTHAIEGLNEYIIRICICICMLFTPICMYVTATNEMQPS